MTIQRLNFSTVSIVALALISGLGGFTKAQPKHGKEDHSIRTVVKSGQAVEVNSIFGGAGPGSRAPLTVVLPSESQLHRVSFEADDNVGKTARAAAWLYIDGTMVGDKQNIAERGGTLQWNLDELFPQSEGQPLAGKPGSVVSIVIRNENWLKSAGGGKSEDARIKNIVVDYKPLDTGRGVVFKSNPDIKIPNKHDKNWTGEISGTVVGTKLLVFADDEPGKSTKATVEAFFASDAPIAEAQPVYKAGDWHTWDLKDRTDKSVRLRTRGENRVQDGDDIWIHQVLIIGKVVEKPGPKTKAK